jgi:hypothetical protein
VLFIALSSFVSFVLFVGSLFFLPTKGTKGTKKYALQKSRLTVE